MKQVTGILLLLGFALLQTIQSRAAAPQAFSETKPATSSADDFPFAQGARWVLRNSHTKTPVVLTVKAASGNTAEVTFDNPWFNTTFFLRRNGAALQLDSLGIHGLRAAMPAGTVYFDFGAPPGRPWTNQIGTIQVVNRDRTIAGFQHCITFQETNKEGHKNYWSFAPGVGPVQFGEDAGAFTLAVGESSLPSRALPAPPVLPVATTPPPAIPPTQPNAGWIYPHVALANNTAANEWLTPISVNRRFKQAVDAGVTYVYLSPKWNEIESSPGKYKFSDIDFQVSQASDANLPIILNVRVIDTNRSTVPNDLQGKAFDDAEVRRRLLALLDALAPHLKNRVAYCLIGNEIDPYFKANPEQVAPYSILFREARARAQQRWNGAPTSATITFDGLDMASHELKPILQYGDYLSLTYYPLRPDFTVRPASTVAPDLQRVIRAAGNRRVLLQEVGYPTSKLNGSSESQQADVFSRILTLVAGARDRFIGVDFLFLSDFSDSVTSDLAKNYDMPNAAQFKSFLQTLGMLDGKGNPKQSWEVFKQQAPLVAHP